MKHLTFALTLFGGLILTTALHAQIESPSTEKSDMTKNHSFYVGISNKFTSINGEYANIGEIYGGWVFNRKLMLGLEVSALTNNIIVPDEYNAEPDEQSSYMYWQAGIVSEYTRATDKKFHVVFHFFSGVGFTYQYERSDGMEDFFDDILDADDGDQNSFVVAEPGVQLEINILKWLRLSPGVSYRATIGSNTKGLDDGELSNLSYNLTLKAGKF